MMIKLQHFAESYSVGSVTPDSDGRMISKNVQTIERYAIEHGLMNNVLCPTYIHKKSNSFLLALQVRSSVKIA